MESCIEHEMVVTASVCGSGTLVVRGCLEGDVELPNDEVIIEKGGFVEGTVHVRRATIAGEFRGTMTAEEQISVRATGAIKGKLNATSMEIQDGAKIEGEYEIGEK